MQGPRQPYVHRDTRRFHTTSFLLDSPTEIAWLGFREKGKAYLEDPIVKVDSKDLIGELLVEESKT